MLSILSRPTTPKPDIVALPPVVMPDDATQAAIARMRDERETLSRMVASIAGMRRYVAARAEGHSRLDMAGASEALEELARDIASTATQLEMIAFGLDSAAPLHPAAEARNHG